MGQVYQRGRWWHCRYTVTYPDGRKVRVRESLHKTNKANAEKKFREIMNSIDDGSYFKAPPPKMREVLDRYVLDVALTHDSFERELEIASHFYSVYGDTLVSKVTTSKLATYKARRLDGTIRFGRKKKPVTEPTVKRELSFLRQVFSKATELWTDEDDWDGYFKIHQQNPVKAVIKGMEDVERERTVSPEEAKELKKHLPAWLKPLVIVASQTGHRLGIIANLELNEVIFSRNVIVIPAKKMKSKRPSVKKMTKLVRAIIEAAISGKTGSTNYIFVDENGEPYSENRVSVAFGRACKAAGIKDLRFHDLKHDFGTLLAENDVEGFKRQQLLDHLDSRMSQKYTHWQPSMLNAIDVIEGKGLGTILAQPDENDQK